MSWGEMQSLFAAIFVDEIAAARSAGSKELLRSKVAALSDAERQSLRGALDEVG
jgi:hypothetical protein